MDDMMMGEKMEEKMGAGMMPGKRMWMGCRCWHHWVEKLFMLAAFVSAVLFFWGAFATRLFWGMTPGFYFEAFLIFALMTHGGKFCKCCRHHVGCECGMCK